MQTPRPRKHSAVFVIIALTRPFDSKIKSEFNSYCVFNNVAVAAAHAMATHGLERVAVVDFDVHHG